MRSKLLVLFGRILILRKRGDDMPRKSHRRRRKKVGQPVQHNIEAVQTARPMWRVSVKLGQAWSIAYEGFNPKLAKAVQNEYKSQGSKATIERI